MSSSVTSSDIAKIHILEWLTFEVSLVKEFYIQCNKLYRYFLGTGKLNAAKELFNFVLNINTIQCKSEENDINMNENIAYTGLIDSYNSYMSWKNTIEHKPNEPNENTSELSYIYIIIIIIIVIIIIIKIINFHLYFYYCY